MDEMLNWIGLDTVPERRLMVVLIFAVCVVLAAFLAPPGDGGGDTHGFGNHL